MKFLKKTDKPYIICGDFNGHNPLWGSCKIDHNGKIIEDAISTHNICINSGEGTRINSNQGTLSCIDITLTSPRIATNCKWTVLNNTWGSNHCQILIEINFPTHKNYSKTSPKWSLKKADWNKFQDACIDNNQSRQY